MSKFLDFLETVSHLPEQDDQVADLLDGILGALLDTEGPPPTPVDGLSTEHRRELIHTPPTPSRPAGTPAMMAETWITGNWRCLLLETPTRAMQRARHGGPRKADEGEEKKAWTPQAVVYLDSKSKTFQARIAQACSALGLAHLHLDEAAVHCLEGNHRTFIAWRERAQGETFNKTLRYDLDNAFKNIADGMQKARIVSNDRGMFRVSIEKSFPPSWTVPPPTLDGEVEAMAKRLHADGQAFPEIKAQLCLSHARMAQLFPEYHHGRQKPPKLSPIQQIAESAEPASLTQAVLERLRAGSTLAEAIETAASGTNFSAQALRILADGALMVFAMDRLREGADLESISIAAGTKTPRLKKLLESSPYNREATRLWLKAKRTARAARKSPETEAAIERAIQLVRDGKTVPEAARLVKHPGIAGILRNRLRTNKPKPAAVAPGRKTSKGKAKA